MPEVPSIKLNNGRLAPQVGFGVFQVPPEKTVASVTTALEAGYRSIDTARMYKNEAEVGQALAASDLPREELFVTTKVWNSDQGYDATMASFDASIGDLGLDYVDLYLIHWPAPARDLYVDTWRAFEKLLADGRVRSIGVSNFKIPHLRRLLDETQTVPVVNQVELHPYLQQGELREFHAEHGIVTESWSPLARGGEVLGDEAVNRIAQRHGKSAAQVILRWHVQIGCMVIPRSVTPSRIRENLDLFDFELTAEDMDTLAGLERNTRIGSDPDKVN